MQRGGFLSDSDRACLDRFPLDVNRDDLVRCFSLGGADLDLVWGRLSAGARLAGGLQIGALRLVGFVPDDLGSAPAEVIEFVAVQVDASSEDLDTYSSRVKTRWEHVNAVERHMRFRRAGSGELKELDGWLADQALEHDRPGTLFAMGCDHLMSEGVVRPGVTTIERHVVAARGRAWAETYRWLAPQFTSQCRENLDGLLVVDPVLGISGLAWLRRIPSGRPAVQIRRLLQARDRLIAAGGAGFDLSDLNPNRVRHLAALSRRMDAQAIGRMQPERRYPILAAAVVEGLAATTDLVLDLFDTALGAIDRKARRDLEDQLKETVRASNEAVTLFSEVARIMLDPEVPDHLVRSTVWETVGQERFTETAQRANEISESTPRHHLGLITAQYRKVRKFAPAVLAAIEFEAATPDDPLLVAVKALRDLYGSGARLLPDGSPTEFVPDRWWPHVQNDGGELDRYGWETCVLIELRSALRGANAWTNNSRRYQDPAKHLLDDLEWERLRPEYPTETGISLDAGEALSRLGRQIEADLAALDEALEDGTNVRIEQERLVVTPLPAQDEDPALDQVRADIATMLPTVDLVDLLVEVNSWCGFLDELTHAGNAINRTIDHTARLMAAVVANGCNFGTEAMARVGGFTSKDLAWTQRWYLRTDTLRAGNDRIVNHQIAHPIASLWSTGTLSSSDGQRFPMVATSPRARRMRRYFTGSGATIYTWTSDRHAQYGTRIIPTTVREATHVLDVIFDNETDLEIEEHTTDTAGYTDLVFGLFDMTGLTFSPRIRDIADQRLWRLPTTSTTGQAAKLLSHRVNPDRINQRWDDMCRVAATIRHGHEPASLLVARLQGSARQNNLTRAIQEYGRLVKTVSILRYLHDNQHRRRIHTQLNKGESLHALRRLIFFANQGEIRRRHPDDQDVQGECLTLITNAVIVWNTAYIAHAIDQMQRTGTHIDDRHITRLSPASHNHINFYGRYDFTNPKPPPTGTHRPLRVELDRPISSI